MNKTNCMIDSVIDLTDRNFYPILCAWLIGEGRDIKLRGSREHVDVLLEAYSSTKNFHNVIFDNDSSFEDIMKSLGQKHISVVKFEKFFNLSWPL